MIYQCDNDNVFGSERLPVVLDIQLVRTVNLDSRELPPLKLGT